jgi:serine/threonine protein kinase/tetratricopeptide (TPR) repeat protein
MNPEFPETIDRFQIRGLLGEGGMGQVLHGFDPKMGQDVAIKVIHPALMTRSKVYARATRELQVMLSLRAHPNIVTVLDYVERPFAVVMEFLKGENLHDTLTALGAGLPYDDALRYGLEMVDAIGFAHQQGVLHRDIKPGNVMLVQLGTKRKVKILDFGLAGFLQDDQDTKLTRDGARLGTPGYMAPEQHLGQSVDARTDVYAAGIVLFEMFTGKTPFYQHASSEYETTRAQLEFPMLRPSQLTSDLPPDLDAIILKATARNMEERYPSCEALASDLEALQRGRPVSVSAAAALGEARSEVPAQADAEPTSSTSGPAPAPSTIFEADEADESTRPSTFVRASPKKRSPVAWVLGLTLLLVALAAGWVFTQQSMKSEMPGSQRIEKPSDTQAKGSHAVLLKEDCEEAGGRFSPDTGCICADGRRGEAATCRRVMTANEEPVPASTVADSLPAFPGEAELTCLRDALGTGSLASVWKAGHDDILSCLPEEHRQTLHDTRPWESVFEKVSYRRVEGKRRRQLMVARFIDGQLYELRFEFGKKLPELKARLKNFVTSLPGGTCSRKKKNETCTLQDSSTVVRLHTSRKEKLSLTLTHRELGEKVQGLISEVRAKERQINHVKWALIATSPSAKRIESGLEKARRVAPDSPLLAVFECRHHSNLGRWTQARRDCERALATTISQKVKADSHYYLALMALRQKEIEEGTELLRQAIELAGPEGQFSRDHAKWATDKLRIVTREASQEEAEKAMRSLVYWAYCFEGRGWARSRHYYREYGFKTARARDNYMRKVMGEDPEWKTGEHLEADNSGKCDSD